MTLPPDNSAATRHGLRALLSWYAAMGVEDVIGIAPVRHRGAKPAERARAAGQSAAPAPRGSRPSEQIQAPAAQAADMAIRTARDLAAGAATLEGLRAAMEGFEQCPLKQSARSLVFADGNSDADLMLVGEAPGQMEDAQGLPFVGRSGQLLDRMLAAIGRDRTSAYIANILPWRPPLNRKPELTEIQMCLPFLVRHIELAAPKAVLALGGTAAQHLLGQDAPMHRLRGTWHECRFGSHAVQVMATYHPAYLLRSPLGKRAAWADFLAVQKALPRTDH